jgi:cytidylate kinase
MNTEHGFERCLSFVNCQLQSSSATATPQNGMPKRAVTISRQAGSGGHSVAEKLAEFLQAKCPAEDCPWTIFDRNLVEKVLEDHNLPNRLARFMPEDRISEMTDTMDELFGLHPPSWTLVRQTAETILRLASLGNVILIGRGAAIITAKLDHVFNVRLVGSLEKRVRRFQEANHLSAKEAMERVHKEDLGRRRYLKKYFDKDIDDPLLYHLVINTDLVPYEQAARMVADAVLKRQRVEALAR